MKQYELISHKIIKEYPFGIISMISIGQRGKGRYQQMIPIDESITSQSFVDIGKTVNGRVKIFPERFTKNKDWLAIIDSEGFKGGKAVGDAYVPKIQKTNINVIKTANGAIGKHGVKGRWMVYFTIIKDNTYIKIIPSGNVKPYWLIFLENKYYKLSISDFYIYVDEMNINIDFNTLISLSSTQ